MIQENERYRLMQKRLVLSLREQGQSYRIYAMSQRGEIRMCR